MKHWLLLVMAAAMFAVIAACGDDDDDGGGDALTEEEYFTRMDEIDKELDALFEGDEAETAGEVADQFGTAVDAAQERYGGVNPPSDLEDEHNAIVDGVNSFAEAFDSAVEDIDREGDPDTFFEIFGDEDLAAADEELSTAFCALQDVADDKGIEADVGCNGDGDGEDPASLPPEETTDVLIEDFVFEPAHIQVSVGDTVTWTQGADPEPHTATADDGSFDTGILTDEGETGEVTFDEAGTFSYFCEVHPDMVGAVTVVE